MAQHYCAPIHEQDLIVWIEGRFAQPVELAFVA